MIHRTIRPTRPTSAPRREKDDQSTRRRLLEAAGQVFAEKGFDRATGKEICARAAANTAAVNYHFGGMEGLYVAVVREAHSRLVTFDVLSAAVAGKADAQAKLQAVIELLVRTLTGPTTSSWVNTAPGITATIATLPLPFRIFPMRSAPVWPPR